MCRRSPPPAGPALPRPSLCSWGPLLISSSHSCQPTLMLCTSVSSSAKRGADGGQSQPGALGAGGLCGTCDHRSDVVQVSHMPSWASPQPRPRPSLCHLAHGLCRMARGQLACPKQPYSGARGGPGQVQWGLRSNQSKWAHRAQLPWHVGLPLGGTSRPLSHHLPWQPQHVWAESSGNPRAHLTVTPHSAAACPSSQAAGWAPGPVPRDPGVAWV